eukprot:m.40313 g.40313  ORF g.40313 m.40313 type:complete len:198 (-) comp6917_c0_seq1:414-1007(-)
MLRFLRGVGGSHTLIKSSTSSATSSTCSSTASSVSLLQGYVEDSAKTITSLSTFLQCCRKKLHVEKHDMSVSFVAIGEMQELNNTFRGIDEPTDVLSFPFMDDEDDKLSTSLSESVLDLGDVYICPEEVASRKNPNTSMEDELKVIVVHGLLHLCGFDHKQDHEAKEMASMEEQLLSKCGNVSPKISLVSKAISTFQ